MGDAPWYLGDVDLSKLEGLSEQRVERVKALLSGGEEEFQRKLNEQDDERTWRKESRSISEQKKIGAEFLELLDRQVKSKEDQEREEALVAEREAELEREVERLAAENYHLKARIGSALKMAIKAIHDIEGDESFTTDNLSMAVAYLAALQDPQD